MGMIYQICVCNNVHIIQAPTLKILLKNVFSFAHLARLPMISPKNVYMTVHWGHLDTMEAILLVNAICSVTKASLRMIILASVLKYARVIPMEIIQPVNVYLFAQLLKELSEIHSQDYV
jgi:hypothetical protein